VPVLVDLSELRAFHKTARARVRDAGVRADMAAALEPVAAHLRATHEYQNRTGDLEASTQAVARTDAGYELVAGMEYASHVERLGYSNMKDGAHVAELAIEVRLDRPLE